MHPLKYLIFLVVPLILVAMFIPPPPPLLHSEGCALEGIPAPQTKYFSGIRETQGCLHEVPYMLRFFYCPSCQKVSPPHPFIGYSVHTACTTMGQPVTRRVLRDL
ncbi:hypothetical protein PCANC_23714 [Puccinia coronata f. sp. avenae]|uniref:Uncharacterized protein n=1 Tax=Puccinia coronata f. sp. avenae TaxID=200324 RepID=A0A2N5V3B2_9BASI|nr:hypothetical protein PCANC_23714 [Puccinia coronata f. sp. avenae]PLW44495.1 hypothetical protein PCASD_11482 [Puccinia coronata f. sp. avenae]